MDKKDITRFCKPLQKPLKNMLGMPSKLQHSTDIVYMV